ncbi:MAG TPA: T9SS type A sorting domain-containing protein [Gammaproteobacteria bacterium]|nr:T9SS type A sorting domain-containing protein [Gammaproteobacteria bacterium]
MKKQVLLFSILLCAVCNSFVPAQTQVVNNLCYDEEFTESISVVSDIDLSTLTILDKLKFKKKRYVKKHHEYLNSSGNATHDVHFVSHENMFPQWYVHPSTIRSDETGIKSYFTTQSEYLPEGWTGSIKSQTEHGQYIEDAQTGERYLFQWYSEKANQAYQSWNQKVISEGFLTKYQFSYPSNAELQELQNQGFEVLTTENIIRVKNSDITLAWDIGEKIFVKQFIESNSLVRTVKTYYEYVEEFGSDLIHKIVTKTPDTFDNGDCYETISVTVFNNYSQECTQENVSFRSANSEIQKTEISRLEVFPNPVNDRLKIIIPVAESPALVQVTNVNNELLIQRKAANGQATLEIDVSEFPAGIYIVKCQQGKNNYSTKFVKQ